MNTEPVEETLYANRSSKRRLQDMTLGELITEYDRTQEVIDKNDGRLSSSSSAQLDYDMDMQEDVAKEIVNRLGLRRYLNQVDHDLVYRMQEVESRLRLGSFRHGDYQFFDGYLHIAPLHAWIEELQFGLINPIRRGERPRWIRWEGGAWIFKNLPHIKPGRWGFGVLGVEVGSRNPQDPVGVWLKEVGLWPW